MMDNNHFGNKHGKDGKDEWLTPPLIITSLGEFDLDPCSPIERPWPTARKHYTIEDDGFSQHWVGRIWMNPPYGVECGKWVAKMAEHRNGIMLTFARTETSWWHESVWPLADAILFFQGRLKFFHVDGSEAKHSAGAPSCLIAYGNHNAHVLRECNLRGQYVHLKGEQ